MRERENAVTEERLEKYEGKLLYHGMLNSWCSGCNLSFYAREKNPIFDLDFLSYPVFFFFFLAREISIFQ